MEMRRRPGIEAQAPGAEDIPDGITTAFFARMFVILPNNLRRPQSVPGTIHLLRPTTHTDCGISEQSWRTL
jgi:hypothetical protein